MKNRKNHHLLSTFVRPGIYNVTHPHKLYLCGLENAIKSTEPFSKEERLTLKQKKLEEHLRTSTGIPKVDVDDVDEYSNDNKKKEKKYLTTHHLPSLKNKPQVNFISYFYEDFLRFKYFYLFRYLYQTSQKVKNNI